MKFHTAFVAVAFFAASVAALPVDPHGEYSENVDIFTTQTHEVDDGWFS